MVGNGAPIPGFPRPVPKNSGTGQGWGHGMKKHRGYFGDEVGLKIGVFWGFIPKNPQNMIGETLGTGIGSSFGIYWGFPQKNPMFGDPPKIPVLMNNEYCHMHQSITPR